jgi:hypothetical protein
MPRARYLANGLSDVAHIITAVLEHSLQKQAAIFVGL